VPAFRRYLAAGTERARESQLRLSLRKWLEPTNDTGNDLTQVLCEFKQVGRLRRAITSSGPCGGSDNDLGWHLCYGKRQNGKEPLTPMQGFA